MFTQINGRQQTLRYVGGMLFCFDIKIDQRVQLKFIMGKVIEQKIYNSISVADFEGL